MERFKRWRQYRRILGKLRWEEYLALARLCAAPASAAEVGAVLAADAVARRPVAAAVPEQAAALLAALERRGLAAAGRGAKRWEPTAAGRALCAKLGPVLYAHPFAGRLAPEALSSFAMLALAAAAALLLGIGAFAGSHALVGAGALQLADVGATLLVWRGLNGRTERQAARGTALLLGALAALCMALAGVGLAQSLPVRLDRLALLAALLAGGGLWWLSRTLFAVGRAHGSFAIVSQSVDVRRHAAAAALAAGAVLASYVGLPVLDSLFALAAMAVLAWQLRTFLAQAGPARRGKLRWSQAFARWFTARARWNRDRWFLAWVEALGDECAFTKPELERLYRARFAAHPTPLFPGVEVDLAGDAYFERRVDQHLGLLLFDERLELAGDRFRRRVEKTGN